MIRPLHFLVLALVLASAGCQKPLPEPTPPPIRTRIPPATPIPSPTSTPIPEVAIMSVRGGVIGSPSAFLVHAPPGASCTVDYRPPDGSQSEPLVLPPAVADATGNVRWVWSIPDKTMPGVAHVTVTCNGRVAQADFPISMPTIE